MTRTFWISAAVSLASVPAVGCTAEGGATPSFRGPGGDGKNDNGQVEGENGVGVDRKTAIDLYVDSLPYIAVAEAGIEQVGDAPGTLSGDYMCSSVNYLETRQYDMLTALQGNSEHLWPGALLHGDAVTSGFFSPAVLPRAPMTFSVSLQNIGAAPSATMVNPSQSNYRDEMNGILAYGVTGATAARVSFDVKSVDSREKLALELGLSVDYGGAEIAVGFDYSRENIRSRTLAKLVQTYYTVDVDPPSRAADMFDESVSVENLQSEFTAGESPVYVSSITYGRTIYFMIESEYSSEEVVAALDFAYGGSGAEVTFNTQVDYSTMMNQATMNYYVVGGSGEAAVRAISEGYEGLKELIRSGGDYSPESPGAAIAYKLAYLSDNSPARLSLTDDYTVTQCERISQRVKVGLRQIRVVDAGGSLDAANEGSLDRDQEIFGTIQAIGRDGDTETLWDVSSSRAKTIAEDRGYPATATDDVMPLLSEGTINVVPDSSGMIRIRLDLKDWDSSWGLYPDNDEFNLVTGGDTLNISASDGWRRTYSSPAGSLVVHMLSDEGAEIEVELTLEPTI